MLCPTRSLNVALPPIREPSDMPSAFGVMAYACAPESGSHPPPCRAASFSSSSRTSRSIWWAACLVIWPRALLIMNR